MYFFLPSAGGLRFVAQINILSNACIIFENKRNSPFIRHLPV